ncbi:MAG: hypothetical protein J5I92_14720 [Thiogranum sp.]|nr:hypothetical protein [Thiogranum sp.]
MQWLTLVSEDAGVQRLKADNRSPATTPNVDAVAPYPVVHAAAGGEHRERAQQAPVDRRRNDDRRQGERRREQVPVILDTRSKHDRRSLENRRMTTAHATAAPLRRRINLYA